ncbi:hypothetical protein AB0H47_36290 [Streptomyces globisporus]|uniref:hypothetical protein n=1 Tax=Streptomyces globisporus TaxID=1908 RepID=UPI00345F60EA
MSAEDIACEAHRPTRIQSVTTSLPPSGVDTARDEAVHEFFTDLMNQFGWEAER